MWVPQTGVRQSVEARSVSQYETQHSFIASFLNYAGLVLVEVKRVNPKLVSFVFDDPNDEAAQLEEDFWNDRQITSAKRLLEADREIRREIFLARE